jgi:hypothetical protein
VSKLRLVPLTLRQANELIARLHRHHKPVVGHRFTIGAENGQLVGAAVVGRPTARMTEQYRIAEVTRLVSDGTKNVCSLLYAACARAAEAMGYDSIQTFLLESESGVSVKAAGWEFVGTSGGGDWTNRAGQPRTSPCPAPAGGKVNELVNLLRREWNRAKILGMASAYCDILIAQN